MNVHKIVIWSMCPDVRTSVSTSVPVITTIRFRNLYPDISKSERMAGSRYTKEECILGLEAYMYVKKSGMSIRRTHPILVDLEEFYNDHLTPRSISSITYLMYNFQYQDTQGKEGLENISSMALSVWEQYYNPDKHTLDEIRLTADADKIRGQYKP